MTIDDLNAIAAAGEMDEFIRVSEARQVKELSQIADRICAQEGRRLVLIAGASSAGKTTTAKRLSTQLRVNGLKAVHFSTDDYFVGDALNPRDENGELDYEHVRCVDIPRLAADIGRLLSGETIHPRRFDFVRHEGYDDLSSTLSIPRDGFVVLEGIHALNPILTEGIAETSKYRVFVEPRPTIEVFGKTRLASADARLLRRLVRDNQFRKVSPVETFRMWPKVLAGEKQWIDPFKGAADSFFDSSLNYELAVIKPYVAGLLAIARNADPDNARAETFLEILSFVSAVSPNAVPGDSILRETIGGSQLEY